MTVLRSRRIVTPDGVLDGLVHIAGDRIAQVVQAAIAPEGAIDLGDRPVVPGFVDIHNHGGGGAWVTSSRPEDVATAIDLHLEAGTTGVMVSLMSAPIDDLVTQIEAVRTVTARPRYRDRVLGVHLEGPFLSPERSGAQPTRHLAAPNLEAMRRLLRVAPGLVRVVTLAPELEGAAPLIDLLTDAGVVVALGHSAASAETANAAYDRGASLATHLWNGMDPVQSRAPGLAGASLSRPTCFVELVVDGVHLHEATVRMTLAAAGSSRVAFVTDAAAVAGLPEREYDVPPRRIAVRGAAFDAETGDLLSSTLTMARALRRGVESYGLDLEAAVRCTSTTPARAVGVRHERGAIEQGMLADLVVLDDDLLPELVIASGEVVRHARGALRGLGSST